MVSWCKGVQPVVGSTTLRHTVLGCIRKQGEYEPVGELPSGIPPWLLLQIPAWDPALTPVNDGLWPRCACKSNKSFPPVRICETPIPKEPPTPGGDKFVFVTATGQKLDIFPFLLSSNWSSIPLQSYSNTWLKHLWVLTVHFVEDVSNNACPGSWTFWGWKLAWMG